jgi:hypothetical protein
LFVNGWCLSRQEGLAEEPEAPTSDTSEGLDFDPALMPSSGEIEGLCPEERATDDGKSAGEDGSRMETPTGEAETKGDDPLAVLQYDEDVVNAKYEIFNLQIIHRRHHTGFEETKDFPIRLNDCIAARYQVKHCRLSQIIAIT